MITIWKIDPGGNEVAPTLWPDCRKGNYIAIGWDALGNLLDYPDKQAIMNALHHHYPSPTPQTKSANSLWCFSREIKVGDIVIANKGYNSVFGIGIVSSSYIPPTSPENPRFHNSDDYCNVCGVAWLATFDPPHKLSAGCGFAIIAVNRLPISIDAAGMISGEGTARLTEPLTAASISIGQIIQQSKQAILRDQISSNGDPMKMISDCARTILSRVEWRAGENQGEYLAEDALGKHDDEGWEDTSAPLEITPELARRIGEMEPSVQEIMERGSDEWTDDLGEDDVDRSVRRGPGIGTASGPEIWLGRYFAMAPRGRIELHQDRLAGFFWQLVLSLQRRHRITAWQLSRLAEATVAKTLRHEEFHYQADVLMVLFGTRPFKRRLREEALAVACSQNEIERHGGSWLYWSKVPQALRDSFLDEAFQYTAPGYRDWRNYHGWKYREGTAEYVIHPNARRLLDLAAGEEFPHWHHWHPWLDIMMDRNSGDLVDVVLV